jgi:hypothetical protein
MIISDVCKIRPDHYKVNWVDGWFYVNSVVQDYRWKGDLVVVRYVAENDKEVVAECMGQDESGHTITRFLVVDKSWLGGPSWREGHRFLSKALDMEWYSPRGYLGNDVPIPYFSFPYSEFSSNSRFSVSSSGTDSVSTYSSFLHYFFCLA